VALNGLTYFCLKTDKLQREREREKMQLLGDESALTQIKREREREFDLSLAESFAESAMSMV
jgi:hypothetical protein